MKKLFLLFIAITYPVIFLSAQSQAPIVDSNEIELEKTPITIGPGGKDFPRSAYFLEAYYDSHTGILEILHDGLGDTSIFIINYSGQIVYQTHIYSSNYKNEIIFLSDTDEAYALIVVSDVIHAYGAL